MYLLPSKISLDELLNAAHLRQLHVGVGHIVKLDQVFWVAPCEETEVWDRLQETEVNPIPFLVSEYAGVPPKCVRDGRRYRKVFDNPVNMGRQVLTYCSSHYEFEVDNAVLQAKRVGQANELESASFVIIVCDRDNRMRLPAFLEETLSQRERENIESIPEPPIDPLVVGRRRG